MILTCPECSTRYLAQKDAIGDKGRTVRCSNCDHKWFVSLDPDVLSLEEAKNAQLVELEDGRIDDNKGDTSIGRRDSDAASQFRNKMDAKRRRSRLLGVGMIWGATLGLLALLAGLGYLFRQPIVERYPVLEAIYGAVNVEASSTGLVLEPPVTNYDRQGDGTPIMYVSGAIRNLTKKERLSPEIYVSILNRMGEEITHWTIQPKDKIPALGSLDFRGQYVNPVSYTHLTLPTILLV